MVRRLPLPVLGLALAVVLSLPAPLPTRAASAVEEPLLAILEKDPGNPSALANLGRLAWRRGEKDAARAHFRALVTAHPELQLGQVGLALTSLDRPEVAEKALATGGKDPGSNQGIRDLTLSLLTDLAREALGTKGGSAVAAAAAARALPLAGDDVGMMLLAGQAFGAAGRHAEARELLEKAGILAPEDATLRQVLDGERTALAVVKLNRQEYAEALDLLTLVRDTTPPDARLAALRALALYGLDRRAEAAQAAIQAARSSHPPADLASALHAVLFNLGVLAQQEERGAEALAAFEAAWAVNPKDTETGQILAGLYEAAGRAMDAVQVLQRIVADHPENGAAQTLLTDLSIRMYNEGAGRGKTAWEEGNLREALRYLRQALAIKPRDADAGYYLDKTVARLRERLATLRERTAPPWRPKDLPAALADLREAADLESQLAGLTDDAPWAGALRASAEAMRTTEGARQAALATAALREGRPADAWTAATLVAALGTGADAATAQGWIATAGKAVENLGKEPLAKVQRAFDEGNWVAFAEAVAAATPVIPREVPLGEKLYALIDEVDRRANDALHKAEESLIGGDFARAGEQVGAALAYHPGWEQALRVRDEIDRLGKVKIGDRLLSRAKVYSDLGEFDLAGEILGEAKRVVPDDPRVAQALADLAALSSRTTLADGLASAELAARLGDLPTARKRYQAILDRYPGTKEAEAGLEEVARAEQVQQADDLWDQAQTKLLTRDYAGARELLGRIATVNPGDARITEGTALVDAKERRDTAATLATVARSYLDFGNFRDATATARSAAERFPESEEIAAVLAQASSARDVAAREATARTREAAAAGEWRSALETIGRARTADPTSAPLQEVEAEVRTAAAAHADRLVAEAEASLARKDAAAARSLAAQALAIVPDSASAKALAARLAAATPAVPAERSAAVKAALAAADLTAAAELAAAITRDFPSDAQARGLAREVETAAAQAFREAAGALDTALASRSEAEASGALARMEAVLPAHPQGKKDTERYRARVAALRGETELVARVRERLDAGRPEEAWKGCAQGGKVPGSGPLADVCREVSASMTARNRDLFRQASAAFAAGEDARARSILSGRFTGAEDREIEELARRVNERLTERIDGYLRSGREAIRRNDRGAAFLAATMALAVDPANQEAAELRRRAAPGDPEKAVAEKARDLYFKGVTAYTSGDYQGAIRSWREVLLLQPGNEKARRNLDKAARRMRS